MGTLYANFFALVAQAQTGDSEEETEPIVKKQAKSAQIWMKKRENLWANRQGFVLMGGVGMGSVMSSQAGQRDLWMVAPAGAVGYYFPSDCFGGRSLCLDGMVFAQMGGDVNNRTFFDRIGVAAELFPGYQHRFALTWKVGIGHGFVATHDTVRGTSGLDPTIPPRVHELLLSGSLGVLMRVTPLFALYADAEVMTPVLAFGQSRAGLGGVIGAQIHF